MNLIEELKWRGMLQEIMPGTEEQLNKEVTTAYIGFDHALVKKCENPDPFFRIVVACVQPELVKFVWRR